MILNINVNKVKYKIPKNELSHSILVPSLLPPNFCEGSLVIKKD